MMPSESNADTKITTSLAGLKAAATWLTQYAADVTSQCGEDGVLAKCLDLLPATDRWCVEFGARDGKEMSTTYTLIAERGYRGVLIEPDAKLFRKLRTAYDFPDRIIPIRAFVGFTENDGLDALLSPLPVPADFDLLIIDVDGNDYHIWEAVRRYRPKLVLVEYNFTMANCVDFVQDKSGSGSQGSSPLALTKLGKAKGYELIGIAGPNLIFVDAKYYERYAIPDNSLELMRDDSSCPQIFVAYDGEIKLAHGDRRGAIGLPWHYWISVPEASVQALPRFFRKHPASYPRWKWWALRLRYASRIPGNPAQRAAGRARSLLARTLGRSKPFR
jgi:hypothetical protein